MQDKRAQRSTEELERENAQLRTELWEQWLDNHSEHCSDEWPHPDKKDCHYPLPSALRVTLATERRMMDGQSEYTELQQWKGYHCLSCEQKFRVLLPGCPCCEGGSVSLVSCGYCRGRDIERLPELDVLT